MLDLTPLATIPAFTADIRAALAPYWIVTAEEFVTTARAANQQYGSGQVAYQEVLGKSAAEIDALLAAAQAVLPAETPLGSAPVQTDLGTGAIFDGMDFPRETSFDLPLEMPSEVNLVAQFPPPQQQGRRDTCLAFATIAMYQHFTGNTEDLSEQFVYWACKERDGIPLTRGTRPDVAFSVLRDMGVCREDLWQYNETPVPGDEGQGPPPAGAVEDALTRTILSYSCLPGRDHRQIMVSLERGNPVLIGMPIDQHWTESWQARTLGKVREPLPGEAQRGGHAMVAVGFRDDPTAPGGGYFIVRNSWGTSWGNENPDGAGYCAMPYRLVHERNMVSCVIEAIPATGTPTPQPQQQPAARSRVASSDTPTDSAPTNTDAVTLASLYAEARSIRDQINTLVERLAILMERQRRDG